MKSLIETLSSPHIVAYFQRFCGLQWRYPDPDDMIFPLKFGNQEHEKAVNIKRKFVFRFMQIGSELAAEPFYYAFLPACSWILDIRVARKTLCSLALAMYIGQTAKDILRQKRPSSPPVIRLETKYETEYGMPSTHSVAGTVAPFALYSFARNIYQFPESKCFILACTWSGWVAVSRIYLGMHSVSQVLFGVAGAGSLLYYSGPYINCIENAMVNSNKVTALVTAVSIVLSAIMFRLDTGLDPETGRPRWNTARGDQAEIMGFTTGFLIGSKWALSQNLYTYHPFGRSLIQIPRLNERNVLWKVMIGAVLILPVSIIVRKIAFVTFAKLANVLHQDESVAKKHPRVELPYKFLTSSVSGILSTSLVPWALDYLCLW